MSLRDQLLKAGLVSQEKLNKFETEKRQKTHKVKKDKQLNIAEQTRRAEEKKRRDEEAARKREQDRQLNRERESKRRRKANQARAKQLIAEHRVNDPNADEPYNFQDGRYIRRIRVTEQQLKLLETGALAVARNPSDVFDYPLVARDVALKLGAIDDNFVVHLLPEGGAAEQDEWL